MSDIAVNGGFQRPVLPAIACSEQIISVSQLWHEDYHDDSPVRCAFGFCRTASRRAYDGDSVIQKARSVRLLASIQLKQNRRNASYSTTCSMIFRANLPTLVPPNFCTTQLLWACAVTGKFESRMVVAIVSSQEEVKTVYNVMQGSEKWFWRGNRRKRRPLGPLWAAYFFL